MSNRYFLDRDNSGHWYVVPERYRTEWEAWVELPEEDEASWEVPAYARALGTALSCCTFTDPQF